MILRRSLLFLLAPALLLSGCDPTTGPDGLQPTWNKVTLDERVTDAYTGFGFELFRRLRAEAPNGNVFASPTSAAFALAMTYNGAVGQTADEMALALGIGDLDHEIVNETNRKWLDALQDTGDPRAELAVANSVWYRESFPILPSFRDRVQTFYDAQIEPITTAEVINAWVDDATRGRIDEIIDGQIPADVVAYLINAIYFKADWTYQFDEADTRDRPFHRPDGSVAQVPMMHQTGDFEMRSDSEMRMLRLPYGADRFSMVLALPNDGEDLGSIAARLEPDRWKTWMTEFSEVGGLEVGLPRFEVEWESSLVESLETMGMKVPFTPLADFSGMFDGGGAWIDEVLQKTYLKVDEEGTEAAAVTSVSMVTSCCSNPTIVFDRPFFLAIYDQATETVLFLGQITKPT
ncbi:MAG: serpin family protein [Gemmatimonadota bacterium]